VITPSGVTYERAVLLEHLDKVPLSTFSLRPVYLSVYLEGQPFDIHVYYIMFYD
jgi:hypothetical protein